MTPQEVFTQATEHLRKQNAISVDACNDSAYFGINNFKCPVGIFIETSEYSSDMEYHTVRDLIRAHDDKKLALSTRLYDLIKEHLSLLDHLQLMHDATPIDQWEKELQVIATHFKLELPAIKCE
jgi:hypothetical protein